MLGENRIIRGSVGEHAVCSGSFSDRVFYIDCQLYDVVSEDVAEAGRKIYFLDEKVRIVY